MIKAVIFDMDGVISDTDRTRFLLLKEMLKARGLELDDKDYKKSVGTRTHVFLNAMFPQADVENIARERKEELRRHPSKYIIPLPGIVECCRMLDSMGLYLAVASQAPRIDIEMTLDTVGIRRYFKCITGSDSVRRGKPHPDVYLAAASGLGLEPEDCIAVEDSPTGIRSAKAAGMTCIAVTYTHDKDELTEADKIIGNLEELPDILKTIESN